jgi:hypothetical protein
MDDIVWVENVVFPLIGMGMGTFLLYGVYRTVNRILDRRHERRLGAAPQVQEELAELRDRVERLEAQASRVPELEERLDFAERMLAKQGQRPLLSDN